MIDFITTAHGLYPGTCAGLGRSRVL